MCGRFNINPATDEMHALIDDLGPHAPIKTGEIFPSDVVPVLISTKEGLGAQPMLWGFPRWDKRGVVFNARAETALVKPLFRKALRSRRVVVPTTGFYEWKAVPGMKKKEKYLFRHTGEAMLYLAAFAEALSPARPGVAECFTILTTEANADMAPYHDRMPVLLRREERENWLKGDAWETYLQRVPFGLEAEKV